MFADNWARELESWCPALRVVKYWGESLSCVILLVSMGTPPRVCVNAWCGSIRMLEGLLACTVVAGGFGGDSVLIWLLEGLVGDSVLIWLLEGLVVTVCQYGFNLVVTVYGVGGDSVWSWWLAQCVTMDDP